MKSNIDYKLYLITDRNILKNTNICKAVEEAIKGGVTVVQIREKNIKTLEFYDIAKKIKKVTDKYNIPLIINDRIDIALAINSHGVHLGQDDMPCSVARKTLGSDKIIGISASTLEEALKAEKDGADYIGVGAIFKTNTKKDADDVSIEQLKEIKNKVSIPVVAIGGIKSDNLTLLRGTNIDGVAVISDILGKDDIYNSAKNLFNKL